MKRSLTPHRAMQEASARLRRGAYLSLSRKVMPSFQKGTDFDPAGLTLAGHINLESEGNANAGVGSRRVIGIAVAVDIRKVGGVATIRREQPPVGAFTGHNLCKTLFVGKHLVFFAPAF